MNRFNEPLIKPPEESLLSARSQPQCPTLKQMWSAYVFCQLCSVVRCRGLGSCAPRSAIGVGFASVKGKFVVGRFCMPHCIRTRDLGNRQCHPDVGAVVAGDLPQDIRGGQDIC